MTVKQRLTRSYIYMFLVPLLIAALLLILGVGIALFSLETKYLPRLGLTLWKMHATLEQYETTFATVYKGNIIKNLIMDCQSYTKYRPNETTGGIFVSWRRKEELPTGA